MICGGCCHDYESQKKILSEGITERANVEWTIVHEDAPEKKNERTHKVSIYLKPEWWKGYDVVVHNECFGMLNDNAFIEGITAAHKAGVPGLSPLLFPQLPRCDDGRMAQGHRHHLDEP